MAATIQNLTQRQIMLSFAYLAYCGEEIVTPNPQAQILNLINTAMPYIPPLANPPQRGKWFGDRRCIRHRGPCIKTT